MKLNEFIINTTNIIPVDYHQNMNQQYEIIILKEDIKYNHNIFNKIYNSLNSENGVLFIIDNIPLVYQLIKDKAAIVILKEIRNISCVYKNNGNFKKLNYIEKTEPLDMYWKYIEWYNEFANKNIICEYRFFHHLLYNRFNTIQKFL